GQGKRAAASGRDPCASMHAWAVATPYAQSASVKQERGASMPGRRQYLPVVDLGVRFTCYDQRPGQTPLGTAERVVDQRIITRHLDLEVDYHRAASWHRCHVDVGERFGGDAALVVDAVEDLADDVETADLVGSADAEEDPDRLTDLGT